MARLKTERPGDEITALDDQVKTLKEIEVQSEQTPDKQISLPGPDVRSMKARGTGIADRGDFQGEEILACHEAGIWAIVPKTMTSSAKAGGRCDNADLIYEAASNEYRCPAAEHLIRRFSAIENGMKIEVPGRTGDGILRKNQRGAKQGFRGAVLRACEAGRLCKAVGGRPALQVRS